MGDMDFVGFFSFSRIGRASSKPAGSHTHTITLLPTNPYGHCLWSGQQLGTGRKDPLSESGPRNPGPADDLNHSARPISSKPKQPYCPHTSLFQEPWRVEKTPGRGVMYPLFHSTEVFLELL